LLSTKASKNMCVTQPTVNLDLGQSMLILYFLWSMHYSGYHRKYNAIWSCQSRLSNTARWDRWLWTQKCGKWSWILFAICYNNARPSVTPTYKIRQRTIKIKWVTW
jgi:hypothetical protein